jgi:hypothetical protein
MEADMPAKQVGKKRKCRGKYRNIPTALLPANRLANELNLITELNQ